MSPETVLQSDPLDILFEHRNKAYGAYTLRKEYNHRLLLALGSTGTVVVLFFGWFFFNNGSRNDQSALLPVTEDSMIVKIYDIPNEPPPPPPPPAPPQEKPATIKVTPPVIVPDNVVADPPPPVDVIEKDDALISTTTEDGPKPTGNVSPAPGAPGGTGIAPVTPVPVSEPEPSVFEVAEIMPKYPGGVNALIRFLSKNLRVPEDKLEAGEKIKVPVRFVVGNDGSVTEISFPNQSDEVYMSEIRRVMKKMPKWIPGSQNGVPVAVYFSIPIVFEVSDQ